MGPDPHLVVTGLESDPHSERKGGNLDMRLHLEFPLLTIECDPKFLKNVNTLSVPVAGERGQEKAYRDLEDMGLNQYFGSESALIMVNGMRIRIQDTNYPQK